MKQNKTEAYQAVLVSSLDPYKSFGYRFGLIWESRDDTWADMEKAM
jgi:hypothetical protein